MFAHRISANCAAKIKNDPWFVGMAAGKVQAPETALARTYLGFEVVEQLRRDSSPTQ
jgi:hypothetical protein